MGGVSVALCATVAISVHDAQVMARLRVTKLSRTAKPFRGLGEVRLRAISTNIHEAFICRGGCGDDDTLMTRDVG